MTKQVSARKQRPGDSPPRERAIHHPAGQRQRNRGRLHLDLEMPGVSKEGLEISIENNELSIVGRRSNPPIKAPSSIASPGRTTTAARSRSIPRSIGEKISARINQGVVTLTLPKAEEVKPRKITVS